MELIVEWSVVAVFESGFMAVEWMATPNKQNLWTVEGRYLQSWKNSHTIIFDYVIHKLPMKMLNDH